MSHKRDASAFLADVRSGMTPGPHALPVLCSEGALEGGLSVALDVMPDEVIGALCAAVGGRARRIRVLDVRKSPFELLIRLDELEERWDVPDVTALAHNLNDLLREDSSARAIAVLGEWEDALQLWCVPKPRLEALFTSGHFNPLNAGDLHSGASPPDVR